MAIAVFKGLSKSGASAKVFLKANEFEIGGTFGYLAGAPFKALKKDEELHVPDGAHYEHRKDDKGVIMTFDDGEPIKFFSWTKGVQAQPVSEEQVVAE
jgi:hypothetical protein